MKTLLFLALAALPAFAQPVPCVQVSDAIHNADGTPYRGTITATLGYNTYSGSSYIHRGGVPINTTTAGRISACLVPGTYSVTYVPDLDGQAANWTVPMSGGPYPIKSIETLPGTIAPAQISGCPNNGDVLTTIGGIVQCAPPALPSLWRNKLVVMTPTVANQVMYYAFTPAHSFTVDDMGIYPSTVNRSGHWAMALYDGTCTLLSSTATQAINPLLPASANLATPVSIVAGTPYFVGLTSDVQGVSFIAIHAEPFVPGSSTWTFTGSNRSTGTSTLTFPNVCGQPGVGGSTAGDIFIP